MWSLYIFKIYLCYNQLLQAQIAYAPNKYNNIAKNKNVK